MSDPMADAMAKCSRCGNNTFVPWEKLLRGAEIVCDTCVPELVKERRNQARAIVHEELSGKGKKGGR